MAPAAWTGNKVTGGAYGRLSADFSADQQDTSAIVQIAWEFGTFGTPREDGARWDLGGFG